jgi:hypothetical protein
VSYAFEIRAIPKRDRSLAALMSYGPFNVLMAGGDAVLLSYQTYRSRAVAPDRKDALGAEQLYRSCAKRLALVVALPVLYQTLPRLDVFSQLGTVTQLAIVVGAYVMFFFNISARSELATGLSNLAGYNAPDTFVWPLTAGTPFDFWRRWNVHVLDFLRQAFIYPVARRFRNLSETRSLLLFIMCGMTGTTLFHAFYFSVFAGRAMTPLDTFLDQAEAYFSVGALLLVVAIPLERRYKTWTVGRRVASVIVWQLIFAVVHFPTIFWIYPPSALRPDDMTCLQRSIVGHKRTCVR